MNINKIKTYIGFAIKSRKIIFGYDNIISYKKKHVLILLSPTTSEKIASKLCNYAEINNIKLNRGGIWNIYILIGLNIY